MTPLEISSDRELKSFAETLDGSFQLIDLRNAKTGDGFSWGRYGFTARRRCLPVRRGRKRSRC